MLHEDAGLALCRDISGFDDVSGRFARSALEQLKQHYGKDPVEAMMQLYLTGGAAALFADGAGPSRVLVRELLVYLYTGAMPHAESAIPEDYFESLMWRATLAHPPALSGGYFGHWRYPPEDQHNA